MQFAFAHWLAANLMLPFAQRVPANSIGLIRQRTFLKGTVYYDNRRASIECVVRDLSDRLSN